MLSRVRPFDTPWTVACQAPLSVGFSRREYWSGLPFRLPADRLDPGIAPTSSALAGRFFTTEPPGKPIYIYIYVCMNVYVCVSVYHFALHLKLTQHCKSTIFQLTILRWKLNIMKNKCRQYGTASSAAELSGPWHEQDVQGSQLVCSLCLSFRSAPQQNHGGYLTHSSSAEGIARLPHCLLT